MPQWTWFVPKTMRTTSCRIDDEGIWSSFPNHSAIRKESRMHFPLYNLRRLSHRSNGFAVDEVRYALVALDAWMINPYICITWDFYITQKHIYNEIYRSCSPHRRWDSFASLHHNTKLDCDDRNGGLAWPYHFVHLCVITHMRSCVMCIFHISREVRIGGTRESKLD